MDYGTPLRYLSNVKIMYIMEEKTKSCLLYIYMILYHYSLIFTAPQTKFWKEYSYHHVRLSVRPSVLSVQSCPVLPSYGKTLKVSTLHKDCS